MKHFAKFMAVLLLSIALFSCSNGGGGSEDDPNAVKATIKSPNGSRTVTIGNGKAEEYTEANNFRFSIALTNATFNVSEDGEELESKVDGLTFKVGESLNWWVTPLGNTYGLNFILIQINTDPTLNNCTSIDIVVTGWANKTTTETIKIEIPSDIINENEGIPKVTEDTITAGGSTLKYNLKYNTPSITIETPNGKVINGEVSQELDYKFTIKYFNCTHSSNNTLNVDVVSPLSSLALKQSFTYHTDTNIEDFKIYGTPSGESSAKLKLINYQVTDETGQPFIFNDYDTGITYKIVDLTAAPSGAFQTGSALNGKVGIAINTTLTIYLTTGYFDAIATGTDCSNWFTAGKLTGLKYITKNTVSRGAKSLVIAISGTVSTAQRGDIELTIPSSMFINKANSVSIQGAKYNISANAYSEKSDIPLITVDGIDEYATQHKNTILTVKVPSSGDLYLVITNPTTGELPAPTVLGYTTPSNNIISEYMNINTFGEPEEQYTLIDAVPEYHKVIPTLDENVSKNIVINADGKTINTKWSSPYKNLSVGASRNIYESNGNAIKSTLRYKKTINTTNKNGTFNKTLFIFVADNMWGNNGAKIDQTFVNSQAEGFLKEGSMNDIYDIVTSIYGEEWGNTWDSIPSNYQNAYQNQANLGPYYSENGSEIGPTDEIVIAFIDINKTGNTASGTGGYVYTGNNQINQEGGDTSNEAVALIMDAYMSQANPNSSLTTMAHEFQHAIHHFQRSTKRAWTSTGQSYASSVTWVNETFATLAEDAVSDMLKVQGPGKNDTTTGGPSSQINDLINGRNVHFFNAQRYDITRWKEISNTAYPYGIGWSLGSYLTRTYGSSIIENYMQSSETEYYWGGSNVGDDSSSTGNIAHTMIAKAASSSSGKTVTWEDILQGWGASILLSDKDTAKVPYKLTNKNGSDNYWWSDTYSKYNLRVPSVNYWPYIIQSQGKGNRPYFGMWDGGGYTLGTTGPYIFNQSTDRDYKNLNGKKLMGNTNTFVLLGKNVSAGEHSYTINGNNQYKYQVVLK